MCVDNVWKRDVMSNCVDRSQRTPRNICREMVCVCDQDVCVWKKKKKRNVRRIRGLNTPGCQWEWCRDGEWTLQSHPIIHLGKTMICDRKRIVPSGGQSSYVMQCSEAKWYLINIIQHNKTHVKTRIAYDTCPQIFTINEMWLGGRLAIASVESPLAIIHINTHVEPLKQSTLMFLTLASWTNFRGLASLWILSHLLKYNLLSRLTASSLLDWRLEWSRMRN